MKNTIWLYQEQITDAKIIKSVVNVDNCIYCNTGLEIPMDKLSRSNRRDYWPGNTGQYETLKVKVCPICGWWTVDFISSTNFGGTINTYKYGTAGNLRKLDVSDQSIPIDDIRKYLTVKYGDRFKVNPKKFEEVVASVYKDLGYVVRVTGQSGDEGIDVVLDGPEDELIGIQVKRYQNRIHASQIREFTGALFLKGMTKGIFVTTSDFPKGTEEKISKSVIRGIAIQLVDADKFYDALGIAQRIAYNSLSDPSAPYNCLEKFFYDYHKFNHGTP